MKKSIFAAAAAILALTACNKQVIMSNGVVSGEGYIAISVGSDDAMVTKAAVGDGALANYTVTIKQGSSSGSVVVSQALSAFSEKLYTISAGTYYVETENITADAAVADNGAMRIFGSTTVYVTAGNTTTATIAAEVVNAMTKVVFDGSFTTTFEDYTVTFTQDSRSLSTSDAVDYYWNPGTVNFNVTAKLINGSANVTGSGSVSLIAKDAKTLTFKAGQNGKILLNISADDYMTPGNQDITVDPLNHE